MSQTLEVKVLEASKRLLGEEHPATLRSMNHLANTYWNQGQWSDAEELEVKVFEARKRLLGEDHPNTLLSMSNLAYVFEHQARYSEAAALRQAVQEIKDKTIPTLQISSSPPPLPLKPPLLLMIEKMKLSSLDPVLEDVD
ncbi:hypothetical protein R3P38DRAFT_1666384 [Favolaschia claudopus]|uniref:Kinesin light chain n=1 Tax=Favolaschia claudopus TaxID=2862362 RepID=A0AAW0ADK4_9AGAR